MTRALFLTIGGLALLNTGLWAQPASPGRAALIEQPDAQRTKQELAALFEHYPPALRIVFAADPNLLANKEYLAPYPALMTFLEAHPEIAHNPAYFVGRDSDRNLRTDRATQVAEMWRDTFRDLSAFVGFGMAIGLLTWLVKTFIDYRRWNKLARVQTEVHTKLLDRFTANEDLLSYMQSPAGSKFLQSAPISLDANPRSIGAPLGRILWSLQAGLVLTAAGVGLQVAAGRIANDAAQPVYVLGILGIALGVGFAVSAVVSFLISRRLGLIDGSEVNRAGGPS